MSVESVNNNSNAGLYAVSMATLGAGAGAATGYLTKPYLKDNVPTDSFSKKIYENIKKDFPEQAEAIEKSKKAIEEAKTIEDLKKVYVKTDPNVKIEPSKMTNNAVLEFLKSVGIKDEYINKLKNIKTLEDAEKVFDEMFAKEYAGKNVDEIKTAINEQYQKAENEVGKTAFKKFWDSDKKEFKNCEEGLGKSIKSTAKSIQGKYALIYGSISAAVLGGITYLAMKMSDNTNS